MSMYIVSKDGTVLPMDDCVIVELTDAQAEALQDHPRETERYHIAKHYVTAEALGVDYNPQVLRDEITRCKLVMDSIEGDAAEYLRFHALDTRVNTLNWILEQMFDENIEETD